MVTYDFYLDEYLGSSIPEANWEVLERDASAKLRQYKKNYTVTAEDENSEAMAVCAMAETLDYYESMLNGLGLVQSASIGSVSVNYGGTAGIDFSPKSQEKALYQAARMYLDIYRG